MKSRLHLFVIAAFVALVGVFFYQTFAFGRLPVPADALVGLYHPWRDLYADTNPRGVPFKNFLITDPVRQQIPWRKTVIDQWRNGEIPGWNPYAFSGTSLAGNIQAAPWYPLNVLFFLMPFAWAWTALIVLQPLLGGLFAYLYLSQRKFSASASFLGAVAFAFSGFSVAWMTWGTILHVALWLPLALLAIDRKKTWLLAVAVSLMVVAGHIQIALYAAALLVVYAAWHKRIRMAVAAVPLAALFTLPATLPLIRQTIESGRVLGVSRYLTEGWFLPFRHLAQFFAPDFFGNPATLNYWGTWNYGEMVGYIGLIPMVFAISAVLRRRDSWVRLWMWVVAGALLFAVASPVSQLPFILNLPVLSTLQPTRLLVLAVCGLVMLAVAGFDEWHTHKKTAIWKALLIAGGVLAVLWAAALYTDISVAKRNLVLPTALLFAASAAFAAPRKLAVFIVLFLTVFDLFRFGWKFTPFSPQEYFFPETKTIEFLKAQTGPFRVMALDDRVLPPNAAGYYGIESVEGYDPLYSYRYEQFLKAIAAGRPDLSPPNLTRMLTIRNIASPLFPLLNVKYVLSLEDQGSPLLRQVFREGETRVYEYLAFVPRAYFAQGVRYVSGGDDQVLQAVTDGGDAAVVETPVDVLAMPFVSSESVQITAYQDNSFTVSLRAANPRLLVIATPHDAGWRAQVNGKQADVLRVNYLFFGVVVPAGESTVEFVYAP